jgi:hypothetical protein
MLEYELTFKRTRGFWIFKTETVFFVRIMATILKTYKPHKAYATIVFRSFETPNFKFDTCTIDDDVCGERAAMERLIGLIEATTKSVCVHRFKCNSAA